MGGEFADRDVPVAADQAVDLSVAEGQDVARGGGGAHVGDPGGFRASVAEVDGPEDEHLAADGRIGVVAAGEDANLFVGGEDGSKPSGHP